jgi:hypothetical protein
MSDWTTATQLSGAEVLVDCRLALQRLLRLGELPAAYATTAQRLVEQLDVILKEQTTYDLEADQELPLSVDGMRAVSGGIRLLEEAPYTDGLLKRSVATLASVVSTGS